MRRAPIRIGGRPCPRRSTRGRAALSAAARRSAFLIRSSVVKSMSFEYGLKAFGGVFGGRCSPADWCLLAAPSRGQLFSVAQGRWDDRRVPLAREEVAMQPVKSFGPW